MAQAKTRTKAKRPPVKNEEADLKEERHEAPAEDASSHLEGEPSTKKIGKMHEAIDDHEDDLALDAKIDDETPSANDEDDESSGDDLGLDDEELNPFGDKWEL